MIFEKRNQSDTIINTTQQANLQSIVFNCASRDVIVFRVYFDADSARKPQGFEAAT
jgi:hypothetical protein